MKTVFTEIKEGNREKDNESNILSLSFPIFHTKELDRLINIDGYIESVNTLSLINAYKTIYVVLHTTRCLHPSALNMLYEQLAKETVAGMAFVELTKYNGISQNKELRMALKRENKLLEVNKVDDDVDVSEMVYFPTIDTFVQKFISLLHTGVMLGHFSSKTIEPYTKISKHTIDAFGDRFNPTYMYTLDLEKDFRETYRPSKVSMYTLEKRLYGYYGPGESNIIEIEESDNFEDSEQFDEYENEED